jgi:hypothetical protein
MLVQIVFSGIDSAHLLYVLGTARVPPRKSCDVIDEPIDDGPTICGTVMARDLLCRVLIKG